MPTFSENLAKLPTVDHVAQIDLKDMQGLLIDIIVNKPGSAGSVRVYHYLGQKHGGITLAAAREGLEIYAEHTDDALMNPGKHPNIDRLLTLLEEQKEIRMDLLLK